MRESTEADIKYGEKFVYIQNGKKLERYFEFKICELDGCDNQVKARYYDHPKQDRMMLWSDKRFKRTRFCSKECACLYAHSRLRKPQKKKKDVYKNFLYPDIKKPINDYRLTAMVEEF